LIYLMTLGGEGVPSSRLRWLNYLDDFRTEGFAVQSIHNSGVKSRIRQFLQVKPGSLVIIQKKLLTLLEILILKVKGCQLIFDIDDTVWLTHPQSEIPFLSPLKRLVKRITRLNNLRFYSHLICANEFLKEQLLPYNNSISVIPTSPSDTEFENVENTDNTFRIVWTGTAPNFFYLEAIQDQLAQFLNNHDNAELCIISNSKFIPTGLTDNSQVRNIEWTIDAESNWIQASSIGIMPLTLDNWSAGKSAFKILKYMKLKIPVIATDFGYQRKLIKNGENGFLVSNEKWGGVLEDLYDKRTRLGSITEKGYMTYMGMYSKTIILKQYLSVLEKFMKTGKKK